ncbi:hypothetical protein VFPFJ_07137 [Purpureocillium lilacinum]|uniref:Uncharacterized protein n=1 Tax=Purpureocillium lilacinum TaxID=33203 RepID=A0A179HFD4_PURLI|nr:hypothetical protein VFPFJ_07137 [Purpureocillium lilacinum]OAQ88672.1 hypothetical protein VFPFJ_07137 [Purpureocillium lilacinum]
MMPASGLSTCSHSSAPVAGWAKHCPARFWKTVDAQRPPPGPGRGRPEMVRLWDDDDDAEPRARRGAARRTGAGAAPGGGRERVNGQSIQLQSNTGTTTNTYDQCQQGKRAGQANKERRTNRQNGPCREAGSV